jgi:hypothetical protein
MKLRFAFLIALFAFAISMGTASAAEAPSAQSSDIQVQDSNGQISLVVLRSTDLHSVLDAICKKSGSECEVTPAAAQITIAPMKLTAAWEKMITQLLEGTGMNYVVSPARGPRAHASLRVEPRGAMPAMTSPAPAPAVSARNEQPPAEPSSPAMAAAATPSAEPEHASETGNNPSDSMDAASPSQNGAVLPYPDADGKPIPMPTGNSGPVVLPYPGPDGKPIQANVTNQPSPVLPYADPQGHAIPAPPVTNAKTGPPIPSNYPK